MTENIPRVIPKGMGVEVDVASYTLPPLFQWLQQAGNVPTEDMRRTFNMGVGMICVVDPANVEAAKKVCPELWHLGTVVEGEGVKYV